MHYGPFLDKNPENIGEFVRHSLEKICFQGRIAKDGLCTFSLLPAVAVEIRAPTKYYPALSRAPKPSVYCVSRKGAERAKLTKFPEFVFIRVNLRFKPLYAPTENHSVQNHSVEYPCT